MAGPEAAPEELPDKLAGRGCSAATLQASRPSCFTRWIFTCSTSPVQRVGGRPSLPGKLRGTLRAPAGFREALRQGGLRYVVGIQGDRRVWSWCLITWGWMAREDGDPFLRVYPRAERLWTPERHLFLRRPGGRLGSSQRRLGVTGSVYFIIARAVLLALALAVAPAHEAPQSSVRPASSLESPHGPSRGEPRLQ